MGRGRSGWERGDGLDSKYLYLGVMLHKSGEVKLLCEGPTLFVYFEDSRGLL